MDWLLAQDELPDLVFEGHLGQGAPGQRAALRGGGFYIQAVDLTPAASGPLVCRATPVNLAEHLAAPNLSMITCGGQATIPIVYAVSRVVPVRYAEIVARRSRPGRVKPRHPCQHR